MHTARPGQPVPAPAAAPAPARRAALVVAGTALLVALLGWAVTAEAAPLVDLDGAVSRALYAGDDRAGWLDLVLQVATAPGLAGFRGLVFLPVLVWLGLRGAWRTAAWVLIAVALVSPLTGLLKDLVGRHRPQFAGGGATWESLSFPSGHSSGIACLVTVALVLGWPLLSAGARRGWLATGVALVLLVGLTRLWLGVHFLSDVVGGWALGVGWTLLVALLFQALPGGRSALLPGGGRR